jgi:DNA-binding transcriptional LysR family regulator
MELRYLRYFVAVADAGSITSAASRLRVAQPALSRQIRALEHELGAALMERNSRGVMLTDAGVAFAGDARQILAALDSAITSARARARGSKGVLRVGYAPSPTAEILPAALRVLEKAEPEVKVALHDLSGNEMLAALQNGKLQFAVLVDPGALLPANVVFRPLKHYPQCVAFAPEHRFARLKRVPLAQLALEPLVIYDRQEYSEYLHTVISVLSPVTDKLRIATECDGLTSLIAAVLAGRGVAIVPEIFRRLAGRDIRVRPIDPPPAPLVVGYAHRVDTPLSPIARRLGRILKEISA